MSEEWRECIGFPGYMISDLGHIMSMRQGGKPVRLRPSAQRNRNGKIMRMQILLRSSAGVWAMVRAHTLVLTAFVGPRPEGMQCCHGDGNAANNRLPNLRWDTPASNRLDSSIHGTEPHGDSHHKSTITAVDAERINDLIRGGYNACIIARWIGCSRGTVRGIVEGRTWKDHDFARQVKRIA